MENGNISRDISKRWRKLRELQLWNAHCASDYLSFCLSNKIICSMGRKKRQLSTVIYTSRVCCCGQRVDGVHVNVITHFNSGFISVLNLFASIYYRVKKRRISRIRFGEFWAIPNIAIILQNCFLSPFNI